MDDKLIISYNLSNIEDWENLFGYEQEPSLNDDGYEISDLDNKTQQIIINSALFCLPVLDSFGIQEWLIRQDVLHNLNCYPNKLSVEDLFRNQNLETDVDFLTRSQWFGKLYELTLETVETKALNEYFTYVRKLEHDERRSKLKLVK
jgi:hypothetical protein|tara:strand:- start:1266 stop:1706 length:441 start_codon:yes stop_codon:yes gene_type:complete